MEPMYNALYLEKNNVRLVLSYTPLGNAFTNKICKITDDQIDASIECCKIFINHLKEMKNDSSL